MPILNGALGRWGNSLRPVLAAVAGWTCLVTFAQCATLSFTPAQPSYVLGVVPQSIAVADIDGDGKADLVTVGASGRVCVVSNQIGTRSNVLSLGISSCFPLETGFQQSVAVADFNGDGKPDIVATNSYSSTVSVLLNVTVSGDGANFTPQQEFSTGSFPYSVAVADINADGKPDLLVANAKDGTVSALLNMTASGAEVPSFAPQVTFAVGSLSPAVTAADINGDGKPDLIVANAHDGTVSVLLNMTVTGSTTAAFGAQQVFAVGNYPYSLTTADINGDGKPDLVIVNLYDDTVSVLLNTTAARAILPTFAAQYAFTSVGGPIAVAAADVDGDGKPDLIVANQVANTVSVLLDTTPTGATTPTFTTQSFATGMNPEAVAAADLNGDGKIDVIAGDDSPAHFSILLNTTGVANVNLNQHGLTGSWYDPATGGQGFEIEVYPDLQGTGEGLLFSGWFTYDITAAGGRRWYGLTGNVSSSNPTAILQIFAVEAGNFDRPPSVGSYALGEATIQFSDCNTGSLAYLFLDGSGRTGVIPLSRLTPNATCSPSGDEGIAPSGHLLSGNWFNPNTSGQGLIFDISPSINNLFAAWYTFVQNGQQGGGLASDNWFTLQSNRFENGSTALDNIAIVETSGGVFDNPTPTNSVQVGTANIAFQSCNAMTLTYHFTGGENKGREGTIPLQRVGPTPTGCHL